MPQLDYTVVDVFSDSALAGNPLAVVSNTAGLSPEQMQAIAREFNLSETSFVERRAAAVEAAEGVRVRIFTTQEELQFAGHPTLGTASVLKLSAPETFRGGVVTLAENVGPIAVKFTEEDGLFGEMTQRDPEFGPELDRAEVARLCGLAEDDLDPAARPQVVSTGAAFAIVVLRSLESLGQFRVHEEESTKWLRARGARWFYVLAPVDKVEATDPDFRARMQFNGGEDPATGSAAGCAIGYLVSRGIVASDRVIHVRQGVEIRRPSELYLVARSTPLHENAARGLSERSKSVTVTDVRVGGRTVIVAKGQLFLP
ncbi:MAG TPA: PhzF family phenazine biosynthesis protein [Terracidiphilus sp.]|jgi:trans-2,3-dihydro-3-hydroxyanthranilate isomerase|nr:PhzF family phenazine biosynthesis protein [Terracidiphilus sp.]